MLHISEKVSVRLKVKDSYRSKRYATRYPDQLTFQYQSQNVGNVTIDLQKNNIQKLPPVLLYDGNEFRNKTNIDIGVSRIALFCKYDFELQ